MLKAENRGQVSGSAWSRLESMAEVDLGLALRQK